MPEHLRYAIVIARSEGGGACVAWVPDLPGSVAHGDTYEAALTNAQDAMRLWLEAAQEDGVPIPPPRAFGCRLKSPNERMGC